MKWYALRTDSVASLATLMLSLVLTVYLLSIRNKSRDGWLITGYMLVSMSFYLVAFIRNILEVYPWNFYSTKAQNILWVLVAIYHTWFSYAYQHNPFRREMRLVLGIAVVAVSISLFLGMLVESWLFPVFMGMYAWNTGVLMRKAVRAASSEKDAVAMANNVALPFPNQQTFITKLPPPTNRHRKAYWAFAQWSGISFLIALTLTLSVTRTIPFWYGIIFMHVFNLVSLTWLVISYVNYAEEYTTFLAKLVGLFLCTTLVLLGVLVFLILPSGYVSTGPEGQPVRHAINVLTLLVPVMTVLIVAVFPIFFRTNLLRPLRQVLEGVQRVNAGDLQGEVPIETRDEIGFLAHNFNQMTHSLRRYAGEMDDLVKNRTAELERKSTELELQKEELQTILKDLKATQTQLIQKEKMASLGELTAGIAHEIQNPLNFVNNFSEVSTELVNELEEEQQKPTRDTELEVELLSDLKQNLQKINYHGQRASSIVKSMLEHSRASTGERQPTDLNALCDEYLRLAYQGIRAKDGTFEAEYTTDFDQSLPLVEVVAQDIGRALLNMINNAFQAVAEKQKQQPVGYQPKVEVGTRKTENGIELTVQDNGNGIPEAIREKIFQPFFTTKPTGQGTGLGLSLSYDIITKEHGGSLTVESCVNEYTEFIMSLPTERH